LSGPFPPPDVPESWRTRGLRWRFNWFPAYRGTGGRITHIAADWCEVRVRLPLNRRTRNYVGTIFGGSLYGALDPIYMIQLIQLLGPEYVVWDKAATIRFKRPGRSTLHARFRVTAEELDSIRSEVRAQGKCEREFTAELVDAGGVVHVTCQKLLSIRAREAPRALPPENPVDR